MDARASNRTDVIDVKRSLHNKVLFVSPDEDVVWLISAPAKWPPLIRTRKRANPKYVSKAKEKEIGHLGIASHQVDRCTVSSFCPIYGSSPLRSSPKMLIAVFLMAEQKAEEQGRRKRRELIIISSGDVAEFTTSEFLAIRVFDETQRLNKESCRWRIANGCLLLWKAWASLDVNGWCFWMYGCRWNSWWHHLYK